MFLASNNDAKLLGKKVSVYRWSLIYGLLLAWLSSCMIVTLPIGIPALGAVLPFAAIGLSALWEVHARVILYENGFIRRSFQRIDICYWHQIWLIHDLSDTDGKPIQLSITLQRGFDIGLLPIYTRFPALADAILQAHIRVNYDYAMTNLQSGKSVGFGPLQLFEDHIAVGTKNIPIASIHDIHLDPQGGIQFQAYDTDSEKLVWMGFTRSRIPNRHLLQHLIHKLQNRPTLADSQASPLEPDSEQALKLPTKTYRTGATTRRIGHLGIATSGLLLTVLLLFRPTFPLWVLLATSLSVGLLGMTNYYLMQPLMVTLDPVGISLRSKSTSQSLLWTEIKEIFDQFDPSTGLRSNMRLVDYRGASIDIPLDMVKRDELIETIHDTFADLHLPSSIQELDNRETLTFGPCTITLSTLRFNARVFNIDDLSYVEINPKGVMTIQVETKQESRSYSTTDLIPNRHLLIDIITHLKLRAESTIIYPDEEENAIPDRLQLEEIDDPIITANFENTDTLDSAT